MDIIRDEEAFELGKTAYCAYCLTTGWKSAITGAELPIFEATPDAVQNGWIAAAVAVARHLSGDTE